MPVSKVTRLLYRNGSFTHLGCWRKQHILVMKRVILSMFLAELLDHNLLFICSRTAKGGSNSELGEMCEEKENSYQVMASHSLVSENMNRVPHA